MIQLEAAKENELLAAYPRFNSIPRSFPMVTAKAPAATTTNTVPPTRIHFVESEESSESDSSLISIELFSFFSDDEN